MYIQFQQQNHPKIQTFDKKGLVGRCPICGAIGEHFDSVSVLESTKLYTSRDFFCEGCKAHYIAEVWQSRHNLPLSLLKHGKSPNENAFGTRIRQVRTKRQY